MNFILILVAMPMLGVAVALFVAARDRAEQNRTTARRSTSTNPGGVLLRSWTLLPLVLACSLLSACRPAGAQEIIHARAGQLIAVNSTANTLTLKVADGSTLTFRVVAKHEPAMTFDRAIRSKTVAAGSFNTVGSYVVVFYYGFSTLTAVAVEDLGTSAPNRTVGSVASFDHHQRLLILKTEAAEQQKWLCQTIQSSIRRKASSELPTFIRGKAINSAALRSPNRRLRSS